ncbi:MAG TPA: hypothetical protein VNR60_04640 [Croceibacterium sp.]|nr:hypothetical protein [Croceibacterium sp.]
MSVCSKLARSGALAFGFILTVLSATPAVARAVDEPLARFETPICPGIVGLELASAEAMVWRIRANLEEFGRRLAPPETCEANFLVSFVPSGQRMIDALRRSNGWLFTDMNRAERDSLFAETGPARAVLRTVERTRDGMTVGRRDNLVQAPQARGWMAHSKIYSAVRKDIVTAQVIFDADAVKDLTIAQLADYATFRALAHTLPQTETARAASILSLFDANGARPQSLTDFDKAYLGALYSGIPNIPGPMRRLALEQATGMTIFRQ